MATQKHPREQKIAKQIYSLACEYFRVSDITHQIVVLDVAMRNNANAEITYSLSGTPSSEDVGMIHAKLTKHHMKPLRTYIAHHALLRYTPKIHFIFDPSYLIL